MARGRTETDAEIERHLQNARRSIRAAMETTQRSGGRSHQGRRTLRALRALEEHTYQIVRPSFSSDPDLMPEEDRAEASRLERQARQERRAARKAAASAEVTDG